MTTPAVVGGSLGLNTNKPVTVVSKLVFDREDAVIPPSSSSSSSSGSSSGDEGEGGGHHHDNEKGDVVSPLPLNTTPVRGASTPLPAYSPDVSVSGINPLLSSFAEDESSLDSSVKTSARKYHDFESKSKGFSSSRIELVDTDDSGSPHGGQHTTTPILADTQVWTTRETVAATFGYFYGTVPYQVSLALPVSVFLLALSFIPFYDEGGYVNYSWLWLWSRCCVTLFSTCVVALMYIRNMKSYPIPRIVVALVVPFVLDQLASLLVYHFAPDIVWKGYANYFGLIMLPRAIFALFVLRPYFKQRFGWTFLGAFVVFAIVAYGFRLGFAPFFFNSSANVRVVLRLLAYPLFEKAAYLPMYFWVRNVVVTTGEFEEVAPWIFVYRFPFLMFGRLLTGSLATPGAVLLVASLMSAFKVFMRTSYPFRVKHVLKLVRGKETAEKEMNNPIVKRFLVYIIEMNMHLEKLAILFSTLILSLFYKQRHMLDIFFSPFTPPDPRFLLVFFFAQISLDYLADFISIMTTENKYFGLISLRDRNWRTATYRVAWLTILTIACTGTLVATDVFETRPVSQTCETQAYCSCDYRLAKAGDCPL